MVYQAFKFPRTRDITYLVFRNFTGIPELFWSNQVRINDVSLYFLLAYYDKETSVAPAEQSTMWRCVVCLVCGLFGEPPQWKSPSEESLRRQENYFFGPIVLLADYPPFRNSYTVHWTENSKLDRWIYALWFCRASWCSLSERTIWMILTLYSVDLNAVRSLWGHGGPTADLPAAFKADRSRGVMSLLYRPDLLQPRWSLALL